MAIEARLDSRLEGKDRDPGAGMRHRIRTAHACASGAGDAVRAFHAAVSQPDMALVIFFCSSEYDLAEIAGEMKRLFAGVQVVGCTTAGEIGPEGYRDHSLAGASFPASEFQAVSGLLGELQRFDAATGESFAARLQGNLEGLAPGADEANSFGFLLIDGLSLREEPVAYSLQKALGKLPIVGGSAGDGLKFGRTSVYFEGRFHTDSAVLTLVTTRLPFRLFKAQHFAAMDQRMVVTEADATRRIVTEINGLPAATEYARVLGLDVAELHPKSFAASPVVVMIDGTTYVRSIQTANADGSLVFYCAIENGLVLRVAKGVDLLKNLEQAFAEIRADIGLPQLVLGCDCILRKLEIFPSPQKQGVADVLRQHNTVGFNTYGEQFHGLHVNQTFVGVAIGTGEARTEND